MRETTTALVTVAIVLFTGVSGFAQTTSERWCADSGTWCWNQAWSGGAGLRFIGEPKLGFVFARTDEDNRVEKAGFANFTLIGGETNIWGQIVSAQYLLVTPGRVKFDALSPMVKEKRLLNPNGEIGVDVGWALGLSLFDGVFAFGWGKLHFDRREILNPTEEETDVTFSYVNIQAISAVRSAIKAIKAP